MCCGDWTVTQSAGAEIEGLDLPASAQSSPHAPMIWRYRSLSRRRDVTGTGIMQRPLLGRHSQGSFDRVPYMSGDPTVTDPDKYKVVFENDRVRVLEYKDKPGDRTSPHRHPDSVMYTLSSFERRLVQGEREADVQLEAGMVRFLAAQEHHGENIGTTESHALFVELKDPPPDGAIEAGSQLGPEGV